MLNWLESEGFFLWWDEVNKTWELLNNNEDCQYSLVCEDKFRIIEQAFHDLAH
jgi:hypothetical protein